MYLPPNGASNAAFLETLRLHARARDARPPATRAGSSSPSRRRAPGSRPGRRIAVADAPTSFGPRLVHDRVEGALRPRRRSSRRRARAAPRACGCAFPAAAGSPRSRSAAAATAASTPPPSTIDLSGRQRRARAAGWHARQKTVGSRLHANPSGDAAACARVRARGPDALPWPCARGSAGRRGRAGARAVRTVKIHYRAHNGERRAAFVVLPAWYGPRKHPRIPLVISPHGRGVSGARERAALGPAARRAAGSRSSAPTAQGRKLHALLVGLRRARSTTSRACREIVRRTLPWLRIDRSRIYAVRRQHGRPGDAAPARAGTRGCSPAPRPSTRSPTSRCQYRRFPRIPAARRAGERWAGPSAAAAVARAARRSAARRGSARARTRCAARSRTRARSPASCVPLQLWWSVKDRIVLGPERQSARLFRRIRRLNPDAPVQAFVGYWAHSAEMRARTRLPVALGIFGLLPEPASSGRRASTSCPRRRRRSGASAAEPGSPERAHDDQARRAGRAQTRAARRRRDESHDGGRDRIEHEREHRERQRGEAAAPGGRHAEPRARPG